MLIRRVLNEYLNQFRSGIAKPTSRIRSSGDKFTTASCRFAKHHKSAAPLPAKDLSAPRDASGILTKHDAGVMATKAKTVTHSDVHFALGSLIRCVIKIALWIGSGVIDGGCDEGILNRLARDHRFNPTTSSQ
jgi:hypothetical protein